MQYFYFLVTTIRKLKIKVCVYARMYVRTYKCSGLTTIDGKMGEGEVTRQTIGSLVYGIVYKEALG